MHKNFIFAWLFFSASAAFSQNLEGSVRYLVVHDWTKKMQAVDYISKERRAREAYQWGNNEGWRSFSDLVFSGQKSRFEDSEERADQRDRGYSWRKSAFVITRDFEKNEERDLIEFLEKTYLVEDSIWQPNWKILNEIKEVAGHQCMAASWSDTLKMQKVKAWFALDLPISAGPERFCGLPGLILEIDVNDGAMTMTAQKVEPRKVEAAELALPAKPKGKKISENDYRNKLKAHFDEKRKAEQPPFFGVRY